MAMDSSAYGATERRGVMAIFSRIELRAITHLEKWPVAALAKRLCYAQYLCRRCGPRRAPPVQRGVPAITEVLNQGA